MTKLKDKFEKELRCGAWVISYCFPVEDWEPVKVFDFDNPGKMYIYRISKGAKFVVEVGNKV